MYSEKNTYIAGISDNIIVIIHLIMLGLATEIKEETL